MRFGAMDGATKEATKTNAIAARFGEFFHQAVGAQFA
jgi:hypothetical protein